MSNINEPFETTPWTSRPGLLELLEQNGGQPEKIETENVFLAQKSRGKGDIDKLIKWLLGYRRDKVLCERKLVYIPFIELWSPPGGEAELNYETTKENSVKADISVFGLKGLGGACESTISNKFTIETKANDPGRLLSIGFEVTITRYVNKQNPQNYFDRTDIFGLNYPDVKTENISKNNNAYPRKARRKDIDLAKFKITGHIDSKDSNKSGVEIFSPEIRNDFSWNIDLEIPGIPLLKSPISFGIHTKKSTSFSSKFTCPQGHNYVFLTKSGEEPLVPFCVRLLP